MPSPTYQTKTSRGGAVFEIYAYRRLTPEEVDREIAFFIIFQPYPKPGRTYKISSEIGAPRNACATTGD